MGYANVDRFQEMLRQMSAQFTISQIVAVVFVASNAWTKIYLLHMQNGEYWCVVSDSPWPKLEFRLYKFPPPVPSMDQLPGTWRHQTVELTWYPADLQKYLEENGKSETLYMPVHDDEEGR